MSPAFDSTSSASSDAAASASAATSPPPSLSPPVGVERGGNVAGKKPAWNVPTNGKSEGAAAMGADSWPALSESAKGSPRSWPSESNNSVADQSNSVTPGSMIMPGRAKPKSSNSDPSYSASLSVPARQKPNPKSNSMNGSPANGAPSTPQSVVLEHTVPVVLGGGSESSHRDIPKGKSNWHRNQGGRFAPQHHGRGDHRGGFNGNSRGNSAGGSHQGGYEKGQDYDRGDYERNGPFGFGRDPHTSMPLPHQRGFSMPFIPPNPPPPTPFIRMPLHVRPYIGPMGFPEVPSVYYVPQFPPLEQLRSVPFIVHQAPPAMVPVMDHQRDMLVKQIEYYFSNENLSKDVFLKQKMDNQGWVPISLIAGFNRVKQLTNDTPYILESIRHSTIVEIQGDKIRRRYDWMNWILPPAPKQSGVDSLPQCLTTSDSLATHVQNLALGGVAPCQDNLGDRTNKEVTISSASGGSNSHTKWTSSGEGNGEGPGHKELDNTSIFK